MTIKGLATPETLCPSSFIVKQIIGNSFAQMGNSNWDGVYNLEPYAIGPMFCTMKSNLGRPHLFLHFTLLESLSHP